MKNVKMQISAWIREKIQNLSDVQVEFRKKVVTNADKLRHWFCSMDDKKLSKIECRECPYFEHREKCDKKNYIQLLYEWLQSDSKEGAK